MPSNKWTVSPANPGASRRNGPASFGQYGAADIPHSNSVCQPAIPNPCVGVITSVSVRTCTCARRIHPVLQQN